MNSILYAIYTGEYPNQIGGGPNNIIYKIVKNYTSDDFEFDYLSSDLFYKNFTANNLDELEKKRRTRKKFAPILYNKFNLYRKFFGSDFYLPYHFKKKNKYYTQFKKETDNYRIVHSQDSISLSLITTPKTNSKKIITVHSKGPLSDELKFMAKSESLRNKIDRKIKKIERESVNIADLITFPSISAKNYFEKSLNLSLNEKQTKIIYNGIEFNNISKIEIDKNILERYSIKSSNKLLLLNIAANAPEKNIPIILNVVDMLKNKFNKNVLLMNIGVEKFNSNQLFNMVENLGLKKNVKFLGKLPNDEVIKLLKVADIFIMTSKKVIFDLVVLEALACGTCCVVSNDGGNKEIIKDGENGFLIDTNDVEGIAKKIISILPYKNSVKENAIKTAQQFSVDRMVNEYFELYESLLK